jgi:hypothetical protein
MKPSAVEIATSGTWRSKMIELEGEALNATHQLGKLEIALIGLQTCFSRLVESKFQYWFIGARDVGEAFALLNYWNALFLNPTNSHGGVYHVFVALCLEAQIISAAPRKHKCTDESAASGGYQVIGGEP